MRIIIQTSPRKDIEKINDIISVFGFLYRKIGIFIFIAALIISGLLPFIFKGTIIPIGVIYFAFSLSYFLRYVAISSTIDKFY